MNVTHWKKLTNPNYLGSYSLEPGQELTVKILSVQKELVSDPNGEKHECIVATLENQKPMILNKTNCKTIEKLFKTPYIEDWKNKKVTVYSEKVRAFGETVDALRIKKILTDDREVLTPDHPRWKGAVEALVNSKCTINTITKNFRISPEHISQLREESNA